MKIICPAGKAPIYVKYPSQSNAQNAFIQLDCRNEVLRAGYNPEIGSGVPFDVHYGHLRRYDVPADVNGESLKEFMNSVEVKELCERVIDGYSSEWNGNNHVAELDDDAQEAEAELEELVENAFDYEGDRIAVWDIGEWLDAGFDDVDAYTSDAELEETVEFIVSDADDQNVELEGDVEQYLNDHRLEERQELIEKLLDADDTVEWYDRTEESRYDNPVYKAGFKDETEFQVAFNEDGHLVWNGKVMSKEEVQEKEPQESEHER